MSLISWAADGSAGAQAAERTARDALGDEAYERLFSDGRTEALGRA